jgi:hypothetical protein
MKIGESIRMKSLTMHSLESMGLPRCLDAEARGSLGVW